MAVGSWGDGSQEQHGDCPRGTGVKGCACSRVSSPCPTQGLGASVGMKHAPGRMQRDGRAQTSCVLAGRGELGIPPSAGSTADPWDAQAGCADGVPALWRRCPCGSSPRGELFKQSFSSCKACALRTAGELLVPAEPAQGQWRWRHCPQVGTELCVPELCVRGCAGRRSSQSHTHGAAVNATSTPASWA